jgi:hypothetical protein
MYDGFVEYYENGERHQVDLTPTEEIGAVLCFIDAVSRNHIIHAINIWQQRYGERKT